MPTIFICHDHMMDPLLARISEKLQQDGITVVRGPESRPGQILSYSHDDCAELFRDVEVAMFSSRSRCTRELMASAPRLRAIVNPSIGVETIDIAAASELGILVVNGSTPENYVGMAEASIMLMLNLMLGLRSSEQVLAGTRPRPQPEDRHARTLRGKRIGLIGLGNIATAVARRLEPFEVQIVAHSAHATREDTPASIELVDLPTLLSSSDIVGLFIAVNAGNRHLINEEALRLMKKSAFLVNVSRGDAVDEAALIRALQQGWIAGAALDTFAVEPLPQDSPLRTLPNVILTPHMVGQTRESFFAAQALAVRNIHDVLNAIVPSNCKNPEIASGWRARAEAPGL